LKQYGEPMIDSPHPPEKTIKQLMKQSVEKQKEFRYVKTLQKGGVGPSTLFHFDVITKLATFLLESLFMNS